MNNIKKDRIIDQFEKLLIEAIEFDREVENYGLVSALINIDLSWYEVSITEIETIVRRQNYIITKADAKSCFSIKQKRGKDPIANVYL